MFCFRYNSGFTNSTQFGNDSHNSKFNGENSATNCFMIIVLALDGLTKKHFGHYALLKNFSLSQAGVNPLALLQVPWFILHTDRDTELTTRLSLEVQKGELTHDAGARWVNYPSTDFTPVCLTPVFRQDRIILFG